MDEKTNINQGAGNNADMNFSDELQQIITDNMFWLKRRSKVRQSDLAKGLGISQPTLSQKYSRTIAWTINDLAKAAVFFKVPVSYLVTDNFIEPSSEYRLVHNGPVDISRRGLAASAGSRVSVPRHPSARRRAKQKPSPKMRPGFPLPRTIGNGAEYQLGHFAPTDIFRRVFTLPEACLEYAKRG